VEFIHGVTAIMPGRGNGRGGVAFFRGSAAQ
jgi:hypothetical protein